MVGSVCKRAARGAAFAGAARSYWLAVFPRVRREVRHWRRYAGEIPDPVLRELALGALLAKRESLDGVAAFAAFVAGARRASVVRALTAYQVAFDYIDTISEHADTDPVANGWRLNQSLLVALEPGRDHLDYYAHNDRRGDAGYLETLIDTCRAAMTALPSFAAVAAPARTATARIATYQSLNHGDTDGSHDVFTRWARAETTPSTGLHWWETGAAAGSPLPVLALIAAAAGPALRPDDAVALERAYFPWIAALSTLLDSLLDQDEDSADGQRSLIDYYASSEEMVSRLQVIAASALRYAQVLPDGERHIMILAAMVAFFHCAAQDSPREVSVVTRRIIGIVGNLSGISVLIIKTRRRVARPHTRIIPRCQGQK